MLDMGFMPQVRDSWPCFWGQVVVSQNVGYLERDYIGDISGIHRV